MYAFFPFVLTSKSGYLTFLSNLLTPKIPPTANNRLKPPSIGVAGGAGGCANSEVTNKTKEIAIKLLNAGLFMI